MEVVFSVWRLKCGCRGGTTLNLTSTSFSVRRGKASEVETGLSVGINLLQEEEDDRIAGLAAHQLSWGKKLRGRRSLRILGNPCNATNFLGAVKRQGVRQRGEGGDWRGARL